MGPVKECGPPPGFALRRRTISSIDTPVWIWSSAWASVSTETVSPDSMVSRGLMRGSSQPHCTSSFTALSWWCLPPGASPIDFSAPFCEAQAAKANEQRAAAAILFIGPLRPAVVGGTHSTPGPRAARAPRKNYGTVAFVSCIEGDARDPGAYGRALGSELAGALVTDPPYCLLTRRRKGGDLRDPKGAKIERGPVLRFESVRDYRAFTNAWLPLAVKHLVPGAPLAIWTNFLGKDPIRAAARDAGYPFEIAEYLWAKRTSESGGNEILLRVYETALIFTRER